MSVWAELTMDEGEVGLVVNKAEYTGKSLATDSRVPGRVRGKEREYLEIGAEMYIVDVVKNGYKLVFDDGPPPSSFTSNNKSALEDPQFVRAELSRLEGLGCIKRVVERPYVVLPVSRVFSNKWRLVLDASRGLNPWCKRRSIRLDDLGHVSNVLSQGDFMVCNDLDSGYWHLPVAESHQQYLGVHHVQEDGSVLYWVWTVLVLGLRDAAHVFTRAVAPMIVQLRKEGSKLLVYIDDVFLCAATRELALVQERRLYELFQKCGWVFKPEKRSGEPAQVCRFLGLNIDSVDMTFSIPSDKLVKIKDKLKAVKRGRVKVRKVAQLVGLLQSVRLATGPIVAIMTRSLYVEVARAATWSSIIAITGLARFEVRWWLENLESVSRFPIQGFLSTTPVSYEVASDASGVGHFAYLVGGSRVRLAARAFTEEERGQSSTWRELAAVRDTWTNTEVLRQFKGCRVSHYTDSQAMASVLTKGSRNTKLHPMVMEVALALRQYSIVMEAVWRSREDGMIQWADIGSRDFHKDDISLDFDTMSEIYERFGDFDVDTFASASNTKGKRFFSRLLVPGSAGMDFFHQSLDPRESHFCFPPPSKLVAALRHFEGQEVEAVMVVPVWPNSSYYGVFWPDGFHAAKFVIDMILLQPFFLCGPLVTGNGMRGRKPYRTAVIKVDFRKGGEQGGRLLCLLGGCWACRG